MTEEFHAWKKHFIDQAKGLIPHQKKFYKVSMQQGGGSQPILKMVSPTEQVVERAKLEQPPTMYDAVTGVMQQTKMKHTTVKRKTSKKKKRLQSKSKTKPKPKKRSGKTSRKQKWT